MNSSQDKYAEMRSKLQEGLQILADSPDTDRIKLGMALIQIHSALEDYVRFEIAKRAPELRDRVEDVRQTNWKDLLDYGKTHLGLTEEDSRIINEANAKRLRVAHGKRYTIRRPELVSYAEFVQRKCNPGQPLRDLSYIQKEDVAPSSPNPGYQPTRIDAYSGQGEVYQAPVQQSSYSSYRKPWYRSTLFLLLTFFLLPPLWAFLIVTNRNHGCLARLIAYVIIFSVVLLALGVYTLSDFDLSDLSWDTFVDSIDEFPIPSLPTLIPSENGSPASESTQSGPESGIPAPGSNDACAIVWVEHEQDDLGGMNRSMVWEEVVLERVEGSEMTSRQFYDQVIEQNPGLVVDGYEFKSGKTYLLPECQ